jgi:hypothetical protein
MPEKISWMEAEKRLKGWWIDSTTLPLGTKDRHKLAQQYSSVPKPGKRLIETSPPPKPKDSQMVEKAQRFSSLTTQVRNGLLMRASVLAACRHVLGLDDATIRDVFRVEQWAIDAAFRQRRYPWEKLDRKRREKAIAIAEEIWELAESRLSWREATERLGVPINPHTIPEPLFRAAAIRVLTGPSQNKQGRPLAKTRTSESLQVLMVRYRRMVPRSVLLAAALEDRAISESYIRLVFGASAEEIAEARKVNLERDGLRRQITMARQVVQWTKEVYAGKFACVAQSEAGEVWVGLSNKHIHPPENMVVLRPSDYLVLRKWLEGTEIQQINKQQRVAAGPMMTRVRKRFGAGTFEELRSLCEAYGLTRHGKFVGKEMAREKR